MPVRIVVMNIVLIKQQGPCLKEFKLVPWSLLSSDPVASRLREAIFSTLDCLQKALICSDLAGRTEATRGPAR